MLITPEQGPKTERTGERHDGSRHHDDGYDAHDEHAHDVPRPKPPEAFLSLIPFGSQTRQRRARGSTAAFIFDRKGDDRVAACYVFRMCDFSR
jgi:hypothetical protein